MRFSFLNEEIKSLKYYGSGDLAGGIFVKNVIDSLEALESNISELNDNIIELEDLYRYLWLLSFQEMVLEIDKYDIPDEIKKRIKSLNGLIDYSPKRFINFINQNYIIVLDKTKVDEVRWYEFYDILMELIFNKYAKGIKPEVFKYIEENFALTILAYFSKYSNYYSKNKESVKKLFVGLENTNIFDDRIYTSFLLRNKVDDKFYTEKAKFICERSLKHIKSLKLTPDSEEILLIETLFLEYRKLAIIYNLKCANEYDEYMAMIENTMNEYIKKHGQHIKLGPIDFEPIINELKKSTEVWRFVHLTHSVKEGKLFNNCNQIFDEESNGGLQELFNRIGVARSDKYPYFRQDAMNLNLIFHSQILFSIFMDPELSKQFANYIYALSITIQKEYFKETINIIDELCGIFEMIQNAIELQKSDQEESVLCKALINGCVLNECGYIEKILRNIVFQEVKEAAFFDQDSNTLGTLLKHHKYKILSKGLLYYLEFYLLKEINSNKLMPDERPGNNIRNVQMHNHDKKYESTKIQLCLELLYLVLSILVDLLAGCNNSGSGENGEINKPSNK